jgi:WD40 repeat protein
MFSTDERRAVVADSSGRIFVWDLVSSKLRPLADAAGKDNQPFAEEYQQMRVTISDDGKRTTAANFGRATRCWDADNGKLLWQSRQDDKTLALRFTPDGQKLLSLIHPSGIYVSDSATGKQVGKPLLGWRVNQHLTFDLTPDGRQLVLQGMDQTTLFLDVQTGKTSRQLPAPVHSHSESALFDGFEHTFTPDGTGFIRRADVVQRWDLATGKSVYPPTEQWGHTDAVTGVSFLPDGKHLVSASKGDGSACLWDLGSGEVVRTFPCRGNHLALTRDGRRLFLAPPFGGRRIVALNMLDVASGRVLRDYEPPWGGLNGGGRELFVAADSNKILMFTEADGTPCTSRLYAWEMDGGKLLDSRQVDWGSESIVTSGGQEVLAFGKDGRVKLLAIDTGKPRLVFGLEQPQKDGQKPKGCRLALSPDGRRMAARFQCYSPEASGEVDAGPFYFGDVATGRQVGTLEIEGPAVFTFSSDGYLFAAANGDEVQLWENASLKPVGSIKMPDQPGVVAKDQPPAQALSFSADGRLMATGHADCTVLLWDASLRTGVRGGPLTVAQSDSAWADLAAADAARAYAAVWRLVDDPQRSVPMLRDRLRSLPPPTPEEVRSALAGLDSDHFGTREAAEHNLRQFGERAEKDLRAALAAKPSAERKRRIESILAALDPSSPPTESQLREMRSVMVLERVGTPEACKVLERLAGAGETGRLVRVARDALQRLGRK